MSSMPFVSVVLMSVSRALSDYVVEVGDRLCSVIRYLTKSRCVLPKNGNSHGSFRSNVDGAGGCWGGGPVPFRAQNVARNREREGFGPRSAASDQAIQSLEPRTSTDRRGRSYVAAAKRI